MKTLAPIDSLAFAELLDLCRDRPDGPPAFAANGSFTKQARGDQLYWYHRGYARALEGGPGRATLTYAGRVGDPAVEALVAGHARPHAAYLRRRDLASRLRRAGLPAPLPMEGAIAEVLADAGLFRAGSILAGSVAYQTYGGLLGARLDESAYRTQDFDIAQPAGLRIEIGAAPVDLLAILRAADPSFEPMFHAEAPNLIAGFRNEAQFRIEFLTPRRSQRAGAKLVKVAGLPEIGAQPLAYLEFVLADPVESVLLSRAGVLVGVPAPMRYAVHKLLVSVLRTSGGTSANAAKAAKDIRQAESLIEAARRARLERELGDAWLDAWGRGPKWRQVLREGTLRLAPDWLSLLGESVKEAAVIGGFDCPFFLAEDPRHALLADARPRRTRSAPPRA